MHHPRRIIFITALLMMVVLLAACAPNGSPAEDVRTAAEAVGTQAAASNPTDAPAEEQPTEQPAPTEAPAAPTANLTDGCVENYAEGIDYFPDKIEIQNATGFTVEYHDNYKVVTTLRAWPGSDQQFEYVLVQCGTPAPDGYPDATMIEVPAHRSVMMSTTYLTQLDDLGLLDRLAGLDSFAYTTNETVRGMIDAGELTEIAPTGQEVNVEMALDLNPDFIMAFSSGVPEYDLHPAMIAAGLPVVMDADWMENVPLARAEWVKFTALFFNAEATATTVYDGMVSDYKAAAALAAGAEDRPLVMSDTPYEGTWYVPGGAASTAQLIADAGGDYVYADNEDSGTLFLDFEMVYDDALDADVWINAFGFDTLDDMLAADARFGDFKAFQNGSVWANDKRGSGFNTEYYETGVVHPHVVLQDLVKIFHPDLLPDHELYYYRQVP